MKDGLIIVNKGAGLSSQAVVNRIKRLCGVSKAGHTGTLDPMATGVLPVLIGRAVKASEYMITSNKHYRATLLLGVTTDTEDTGGAVLTISEQIPEECEVIEKINSMLGESEQIPPMYSAIKMGGKKLYELAREGKSIEREPRKITVYEISGEKISEREYKIDVKCSKGTYIRTLCADIGKRLGCGGAMKTLERVSAAGFSIDESHTLEELEALTEEEIEKLVIPTEEIFTDKRRITLAPFFARLARCGAEIYLNKIGITAEPFERVTLYDEKGFFALGEVREFDSGRAIKPIKQFDT